MNTVYKHFKQSAGISATWSWYDQGNGLVKWTFTNSGSGQASAILLRSGYYFGNAFWPVYDANPEFGTSFANKLSPLVDQGVENNSPPLAVINLNGQYIVAFVFTLSPGQAWSMLEGGFVDGIEPSGVATYDVLTSKAQSMCVGYSQEQVTAWDEQTGTNLQGYSPNPSTFDVVVCNVNAPFIQLFNDPITTGSCTSSQPPDCGTYLQDAISDFQQGNIIGALNDVLQYYECVVGIASSASDQIRKVMRGNP